jgi:ribonucleoside-diphosphate reductase alpha chain
MRIERHFTSKKGGPYEGLRFVERNSEIRNPDGSLVFQHKGLKVPEGWSQVATDILAQKYFRKAGVPQVEGLDEVKWQYDRPRSHGNALVKAAPSRRRARRAPGLPPPRRLLDLLGRASTATSTAEEDAKAFYDELCYMLATQMARPTQPAVVQHRPALGLRHRRPRAGPRYVDPKTGKLKASRQSAYERPQPHACFIQSVSDDLVNDGGIMDLWTREARLFKYGSGTGSNFSSIRGADEPLSGGGKSARA